MPAWYRGRKFHPIARFTARLVLLLCMWSASELAHLRYMVFAFSGVHATCRSESLTRYLERGLMPCYIYNALDVDDVHGWL